MGLLDSVIGALGGSSSGDSGAPAAGGVQAELLRVVLGMLAQGGSAQGGGGGLGGVLGSALGGAVSGALGGAQGGSGGLGGLGGLVSQFEQAGLGHVVSSWVGHGENLPISADQLSQVLGGGALGQIAQQVGLSHGETADQLSQLLPQLVDKLTPEGTLPSPEAGLGQIGDILSRFGR